MYYAYLTFSCKRHLYIITLLYVHVYVSVYVYVYMHEELDMCI